MKPMTIHFALAAVILALPSVAQAPVIFHRHHSRPLSPETKARFAQAGELQVAGEEALHNGDFIAAEEDFRDSIKISTYSYTYYGLGEALAGQGRTVEAIEAYRVGIYTRPGELPDPSTTIWNGQDWASLRACPGAAGAEVWMKYALLLSQTGQEAEAVAAYTAALPQVPDVTEETINRFPDGNTLLPAEFQATAHIALGLCAAFSGDSLGGCHEKAMSEFGKALQLAPDAALTNYYYGYGWQQLSPAGRTRFGTVEQARAALLKAARIGKGDVKKAAQKALRVAMNPK